MASENTINAAKRLLEFINKSPSPYHAVQTMRSRLLDKGFKELRESDHWNLKPNDRVFFTRDHATMYVIAIGGKYEPGNGFSIIGAHTDSPCLKIKPKSLKTSCGFIQLGVQPYGGGLWYSWFDRELKIAGKVISKDPSNESHLRVHLVNIDRPVCMIPSLAIHLNNDLTAGFKPSLENHLPPILSTTIYDQLCAPSTKSTTDPTAASTGDDKKAQPVHPPALLKLIAEQLKIEVEDIMDMDLCLSDSKPSMLGGINNEFIFSPRLDNLFNCFTSLEAMIDSSGNSSLSDERNIRIACMFDHEEVGSESVTGAGSGLTAHLLKRLIRCISPSPGGADGDALERSLARSMLVSADQAHALHPNYSEKHEANHRPELHRGVVLKVNANQHYASSPLTLAVLREVARRADVPLQDFVVNQDMRCGTTIGPILSSKLAIATVDVGGPMLAMHSCRETCDVTSVQQTVQLFSKFYECFSTLSFAEEALSL